MSNISNFNAARAEKADDSRLWTPRDALEYLLCQIDSGEVNSTQLVIHYLEDPKSGGHQHGYIVAGVTRPEHVALLAVAQHWVIKEWVE